MRVIPIMESEIMPIKSEIEAREVIKSNRNSIMITIDDDGQPVDRVMWTARVDDDFHVYYATSRGSDKIQRIMKNPKVLILWLADKGYISLKGKAEVTDDRELLDSLWEDSFAAYFPKGKTDPDYVVIHITPIDVVSYSSGQYSPNEIDI